MVRILNLPQEVLDLLAGGDLTVGHVRPLLALNSAEQQIKAAEEMRKKQMTVREAEEFTKGLLEAPKNK